ncbi:MAG: AMP-binding protein, partial [Bacteroidales bacterium]|nr:AMP-binding protein [Bacteroidales bacterium]
IQVPVYPTISPVNFEAIINDADPAMFIIESVAIMKRFSDVLLEKEKTYSLQAIEGINHYHDLLHSGKIHQTTIDYRAVKEQIDEHETATIIYTSGTTNTPKGVMLSHKNIISNMLAIAPISGFSHRKRALSILPLCHVYERTLNYMYQYLGLSIYYCHEINKAGEIIKEVKPHVFCAVPRILEKSYYSILLYGYQLKGVKRWLYKNALQTGKKYELSGRNNVWYAIKLGFFRLLVFRKIKKFFGGKLRIVVSGSASLSPLFARTFWAMGINVLEGYGLTETAPVIAVNRKERKHHRIGTVGPLLDDIEVKINDDGEILCKGPNVMAGYWRNEALTKTVIDDEGFFHTGDIGSWVAGKFLQITDRKKELFKTSGGKYIAPQPIENLFTESPFFDHVMILGENRHFPAAIISLEVDYLKSWCRNRHIPFTTMQNTLIDERVILKLYQETEKYNKLLGKTEMVKRFLFVTEPWNVESGELSPTLKMRRRVILEKYHSAIASLYSDEGEVKPAPSRYRK